MCLIVNTNNATTVPTKYLTSAYSINSDGFGAMYVEKGRVKTIKGMYNLQQIHSFWDKLGNRPVAAHFRFATVGHKDESNCHPFQIFSKEEHGKDLFMMHNGTFHRLSGRDPRKSDTAVFADNFRKLLLNNSDFDLQNPEHQKYLENEISYNKLLFMDDAGTVTIINKSSGHTEDDNWYSNSYSIRSTRSSMYSNRWEEMFD